MEDHDATGTDFQDLARRSLFQTLAASPRNKHRRFCKCFPNGHRIVKADRPFSFSEEAATVVVFLVVLWLVVPGVLSETVAGGEGAAITNQVTTSERKPEKRAVITSDDLMFRAFDCTTPINITTVSFHDSSIARCEELNVEKKYEKKNYVLLQKVYRYEVPVYECVVWTSRLAFICGNDGYTQMAPRESFFYKRHHISGRVCRKMIRRGGMNTYVWDEAALKDATEDEYPLPPKSWVPLRMNGTTYFTWNRLGMTLNMKNRIQCAGGLMNTSHMRVMHMDLLGVTRPMSDMIVTDFVKVTLQQRKAYATPGLDGHSTSLMIDYNQLRLPCALNATECVTEEGAYVWNVTTVDEQCPYYRVREVEGVNISEEGTEESVFLAQDKSLVRLKKVGPQLSACNGIVQGTDFGRLFLSEDVLNSEFARSIPPEEGSSFLYSDLADKYIYHKARDDIEEAVHLLQKEDCEHEAKRDVLAYAKKMAETKTVVDGDTAHLGQGTFVAAAGDGGYIFRCRPILVQASPKRGVCYNALPVRLSDEDARRYQLTKKEPVDPDHPLEPLPLFYLEPKTHRLITTAAENPCVRSLPAIYKNAAGKWLSYQATGLQFESEPLRKGLQRKIGALLASDDELEVDGRGLYDTDTIREIEVFLQARRATDGIPWELERVYRQKHGQRSYNPAHYSGGLGDFYFDAPTPKAMSLFHDLSWFWNGLEKYGQICSVIIATALLWRFSIWITGVILRLCSVPESPNVCLHVLAAFMPDLARFIRTGRYTPDGGHGPCTEMVRACSDRRGLREHRPAIVRRKANFTQSKGKGYEDYTFQQAEVDEVRREQEELAAQQDEEEPPGYRGHELQELGRQRRLQDIAVAPPPSEASKC